MSTVFTELAPLLLRGGREDRRSQALPVIAFAVVTALTLTVVGGTEFFVGLGRDGTVDSSVAGTYVGLSGVALTILAVPLLSLCASAVRLSTRRRDTRLSSLRLIGAPRSLLVRLSVLEAGALAGLGVALGVLLHLALSPLFGLIPFVGGPIGAGAVLPSPGLGALTALALVGTAVAASALGLRAVAITPLGIRTREVPAGAHWLRLVVGGLVIGGLVLVSQQVLMARSELVAILMLVVVLGAGMAVLNLLGPVLLRVRALAALRRDASGERAVARLLAARTVLDDPKAAWRQVSGVALVSFTSVVVGTGLALLDTTSAPAPSDVAAPQDLLMVDIRTGVYLTIGLAFLTMAASMSVHAAAEAFDRRDLYVALDRLGTPRPVLESSRVRVLLQPLVTVCVFSAATGAALVLPLAGIAMLTAPVTLASVLGALVLGVLVVRLAVMATTPLLRQVLATTTPVV